MIGASSRPGQLSEAAIANLMHALVDSPWYQQRYPDIVDVGIPPVLHFVRHGLEERRDPNAFFDSAWYLDHYPDVAASGIHPLLHYLAAGMREMRNPHPRFDATWYVDQHPEARDNPLVFHLTIGRKRGYLTEKPIDIADYLPSQAAPPTAPARVFVDVIIPAYRGLEETRRCLATVLADPDRPMGRIIVVDDCSPEPALSDWLRHLADDGRIHLVRHTRNRGFVVSVNRGMQEAGDHDVVLLNSDTEVPAGWLRRLMAHAHAAPGIASVSPMSNNATICGWPNDTGSPLPPGRSLAEMDAFCRQVNAGRSVPAPTTVGFCMYIPRAALRALGEFDADAFALGYGEENDFCLRARAQGWTHRIACDTFVYHAGSVSFSDRATKLSDRAMKVLTTRYPHYAKDVASHIYRDAIGPYRFALTAALFRTAGLPVILLVSHDLGGGIQKHLKEIVARLAGRAQFLLLAGTQRGATLSVPALEGHPTVSLPDDRMDDLLALLRTFAVSRVHIHHLLGVDMDVARLIRQLDVTFDVTVHDYYAICPQINFLPFRYSHYCGEPDIGDCNRCIAHRDTSGARDIVSWRADRAWQFLEADRVLCPSRDVMDRLRRHGLGDRTVLAPHEAVPAGPWPIRLPRPARTLRVAVIGTLVDHKGARVVASLAEAADPSAIALHLIGHIDGPFPAPALERMTVTGAYKEADLPDLLRAADPHIIWFPMTWPETYSFTLSAAIAQGCAIVAPRLGAFPERLENRPFTWLRDVPARTADWLALFEEIRTALRAAGTRPAAPRRAPVADFYATDYLDPSPARRRPPASGPGRPRIMVIPELYERGHPTPCAYIRLLQPLHHPAIAGDAQVRVTTADSVLNQEADVIITQRSALADLRTVKALAAHARRIGASLVVDLDDDLLNVPASHPDAEALRPRAAVVKASLDAADIIWVSTPALAEAIGRRRREVTVIGNALDERLWRPTIPDVPRHDEPVGILVMGTASHKDDFDLVAPALTRLKREYGAMVRIDVLGMTGHALPEGITRVSPSAFGHRSYPAFVDWLCGRQPGWQIGLAPLLDTPFNRCKSALKALDYTALGVAVLASAVPVYQGSLADGPAGRLVANDPAAWYAVLDRLMRDQTERRHLVRAARPAFLAAGTLGGQAGPRRAALLRAIRGPQRTESAA
ncbi:glycosyltransferase [Rhodopila sp.]|uniref:glycosyltransferase n=1 Tax=Rhodopila sp. TaxID=2480087 RepID=UPI002B9807D4|nr:glycosyltransferase [Rhodopila sp.]HVZ10174.1 glycosyltransferase [Rhodopila sp.]